MGFRVFFPLASLFAGLTILLWLEALMRGSNPSRGLLTESLWHAHELLFGFTFAVVAGFLLTAARNWTKRNTLHGAPLFALALIWLLARVAMLGLLPLPRWGIAALCLAFPLILLLVLGRVILKARSRRNYGILLLLFALLLAELVVQLEIGGLLQAVARPALYATLHLMVLLGVVIGGRVIPLFTRNRTGAQVRSLPTLDKLAIGSASMVVILAPLEQALTLTWLKPALAAVALLSGVMQLLRMRHWGLSAALKVPMLAVLHLGAFWIGAGQLLLALSLYLPSLPTPLALHALSIGAIGTLTVGMIARVSLGHTGREIVASVAMRLAFAAITLSVLARLGGVFMTPAQRPLSWWIAGGLFFLAYLILFLATAPILMRARPDGREG